MIILNAKQIREWDQFTIINEPIASIDLMERAASRCVDWIMTQNWQGRHFKIFCGKGNNGGDGLAIARILLQKGYRISVYILEFGNIGTPDFQANLERLHELPLADIHFIQSTDHLPELSGKHIIIDALIGSGLRKPTEGLTADLVNHLNASGSVIVAIDLPSGLHSDASSLGHTVVRATHTLTFQCYKPGLLVQDHADFVGKVQLLDIGLHPGFLSTVNWKQAMVTVELAKDIYRPKQRFAHKGHFGHVLLAAGSYGKIGAAVMAAKACLRSGSGLLTCYLPACGYAIMQAAVPEAMVQTDKNEKLLAVLPGDIDRYTTVGIGPGIGTAGETAGFLAALLKCCRRPMVVDADALNLIAAAPELLRELPSGSILTPHPGEFDRLFGEHSTDFKRMDTAKEKATRSNITIILKGHHTLVACPDGKLYFNSTGNPGMAKGGSGDVLTGMISSLLAKGYAPTAAALLGVWLHGAAGDLAANTLTEEAMTATDIISFLPQAFASLAAK